MPMHDWVDPGLKLSNEDMDFNPVDFLYDRLEALHQRKQVIIRAILIPGRVRGVGDGAYDKQFLKVAATQLDSLILQLKGGKLKDGKKVVSLRDRLNLERLRPVPELEIVQVNKLAVTLNTQDWWGDWNVEARGLCRKIATIKALLPKAERKVRHIGSCLHHMENEVKAIEHLHRKVG